MSRKKDTSAPPGGWIALCRIIDTLLDRFGWPGVLLLLGMYFVLKYATPEQKIAIINTYMLGSGVRITYPFLILGGVGVLAFGAQRFYYRKKIRLADEELKRLGQWKSEHQEKKIGDPLHHSQE